MKASQALQSLVIQDALYFGAASSILITGLLILYLFGFGLFAMNLFGAVVMPVVFSTGVHLGRDLHEMKSYLKA